MRIGFDMLAVQSPNHGHREIGRYSRYLVVALLESGDGQHAGARSADPDPHDAHPSVPDGESGNSARASRRASVATAREA